MVLFRETLQAKLLLKDRWEKVESVTEGIIESKFLNVLSYHTLVFSGRRR